jgi:hypothetical protein
MPPAVKIKKMAKSCCASSQPAGHDHDSSSASSETTQNETSKPTTISAAPCGSSKLFALCGFEKMQHLPYLFTEVNVTPLEKVCSASLPVKLTSRYNDPPDPPPLIS